MNQHLFLALACQDARPLVRAYEELPETPQTCQWANFLRNHDELDLGRLTGEQRDAVFERFAPDSGMRLFGRGIRRRLAPLLGGDRRRIELAYSLMLTLPGTPVFWYGEEIGMREMLSLEGRNSVRTPMQWSGQANGGFSNAPDDRLVPASPLPGALRLSHDERPGPAARSGITPRVDRAGAESATRATRAGVGTLQHPARRTVAGAGPSLRDS